MTHYRNVELTEPMPEDEEVEDIFAQGIEEATNSVDKEDGNQPIIKED